VVGDCHGRGGRPGGKFSARLVRPQRQGRRRFPFLGSSTWCSRGRGIWQFPRPSWC
jgi:hypothetical protein